MRLTQAGAEPRMVDWVVLPLLWHSFLGYSQQHVGNLLLWSWTSCYSVPMLEAFWWTGKGFAWDQTSHMLIWAHYFYCHVVILSQTFHIEVWTIYGCEDAFRTETPHYQWQTWRWLNQRWQKVDFWTLSVIATIPPLLVALNWISPPPVSVMHVVGRIRQCGEPGARGRNW